MRANLMRLLGECIETGIQCGLNRAYKHTATPSRDDIATTVDQYIWNEIYEAFDFEEDSNCPCKRGGE